MSEQIREQVSAFLDGELPNSETELLLKRLTRDGELRESFGRYALVGEAIRGTSRGHLTKGFSGRVNLAIDGERIPANEHVPQSRGPRWWRPLAGAAVAAGGGRRGRRLAAAGGCACVAVRRAGHGPDRDPCPKRRCCGDRCRAGPPGGHLLYRAGDVARGVASGHCAGAADQLCVRAQQIFIRPRPARGHGGLADRGSAACGQ